MTYEQASKIQSMQFAGAKIDVAVMRLGNKWNVSIEKTFFKLQILHLGKLRASSSNWTYSPNTNF